MRNEPLKERELELLTAGVDGELGRREAAELRDLLARRADATALYKQLRADAAGVRNLPKPAPFDFSTDILARLPITMPKPARYSPRRRPAWMPAAIAASVLFTVSSASYLFFNVQEQRALAKGIREELPYVPPNVPAHEPDPESVVVAKAKPGPRLPKQNGKPGPDVEAPFAENIARTPQPRETAPLPKPVGPDLIGAGILDHVKPLIRTEARLNPILDAGEFGAMDIQALLLKELQRDSAFRLDLFTKNSAAGWETFQKAAKAVGLSITVDARTQDLLNRKVPVAVAVYTEALTPAEVASLLAELSKQVKAISPPAIGSTHLIPAGNVEIREARDLFGVELIPAKSAKPADPKPLSADTLGKIASTVKKDKPAIAVTYLPAGMRTPASQSKDAKDFLARKGDRKPGTVAMVFVVR